jgi:hypothetical protein
VSAAVIDAGSYEFRAGKSDHYLVGYSGED